MVKSMIMNQFQVFFTVLNITCTYLSPFSTAFPLTEDEASDRLESLDANPGTLLTLKSL